MPPYLQIDNFLVVDSDAAICGVEVKSRLTSKTFQDILNVSKSLRDTGTDCFGFAFDGGRFKAFANRCANAVTAGFRNVPVMLAVHKANHFAIRGTERMQGETSCLFVVDFSHASEPQAGLATASFLRWYDALFEMASQFGRRIPHGMIRQWFCSLNLPERAMVSITEDGEITYGKAPS